MDGQTRGDAADYVWNRAGWHDCLEEVAWVDVQAEARLFRRDRHIRVQVRGEEDCPT